MLFTKLRKPLALVLVFLMFFSMVPFGYAAEMPASQFESGVDPPSEESLPEDEAPLTEPTITNSEPDPDSIPDTGLCHFLSVLHQSVLHQPRGEFI